MRGNQKSLNILSWLFIKCRQNLCNHIWIHNKHDIENDLNYQVYRLSVPRIFYRLYYTTCVLIDIWCCIHVLEGNTGYREWRIYRHSEHVGPPSLRVNCEAVVLVPLATCSTCLLTVLSAKPWKLERRWFVRGTHSNSCWKAGRTAP